MKIKFLQDYAGRETAMHPYKAGEIADIEFARAQDLLWNGIAEAVEIQSSKVIESLPVSKRRRMAKDDE